MSPLQSEPACYIISTSIGGKYYLSHIWNDRPHITKKEMAAQVFDTLPEAKDAQAICERFSGFAYHIEELT